jgi:hypothetical protein
MREVPGNFTHIDCCVVLSEFGVTAKSVFSKSRRIMGSHIGPVVFLATGFSFSTSLATFAVLTNAPIAVLAVSAAFPDLFGFT